jgi:hypothetical protein
MSDERKPWDLLPLFAILCQWVRLAQILRLYQDRATVEQILHVRVRQAHRRVGPDDSPCVSRSWDCCWAWQCASEVVTKALARMVAAPVEPASLLQWLPADDAWEKIVVEDVLARLDGFDGPLPEPPEPPEPVFPEAPVTGPPTIAGDLAPRTKAGDA